MIELHIRFERRTLGPVVGEKEILVRCGEVASCEGVSGLLGHHQRVEIGFKQLL